ncbi:MAG TPA: hypothetical protein VK716_16135 [Terracidiphilus sp.]|jgi:hypothetical protein|nr:hypothetical protein [Terracidiphilus sp.]
MSIVPIMWSIWSLFVVFTAAVYIYRSNLARDEEDQIFLDDSFSHEQAAQAAILAKVNKVQPLLKVGFSLVAVASAFVVVYYIIDIIHQFK